VNDVAKFRSGDSLSRRVEGTLDLDLYRLILSLGISAGPDYFFERSVVCCISPR